LTRISSPSPEYEGSEHDDHEKAEREKNPVVLRVEGQGEPKEAVHDSSRDYDTTQPDVIWGELCGGLGLLVFAVVKESQKKLCDHGKYNENAEDLVDGVIIPCLREILARQCSIWKP
jgi:hypothetical protein